MAAFDLLRRLFMSVDKSRDLREYSQQDREDVSARLAHKLKELQKLSPATTQFAYDQHLKWALASLFCEELAFLEHGFRHSQSAQTGNGSTGDVLDFPQSNRKSVAVDPVVNGGEGDHD